MIVEGDVIVVFRDSGIRIANKGDALEIRLTDQDPTLNGFELDGINALEVVKPLIALYLDDYINPIVGIIMGKMNFFPGMGFGRRQQGIPMLP